MLSDVERKILEIMSKQLLINKGELISKLEQAGVNGGSNGLGKLVDMGYIEKVESLGICYVLTQAGQRAVKGE
jgi:hypothetical protein